MKHTKQIFTTVLSVLISVFLVTGVVYAVTTISSTTITLQNATTGIDFTGTLATGISFVNATLVPDASRTDIALAIGSRANELTVDMGNAASQNFEPFQMNVNLTASAGAPTSTSTVSLLRIRSTHDTVDMPNLRLRNINTYMDVQENLQDAYGQMNGVDFYTNAITVGGEAAVAAFNIDASSAVTGNVRGIVINMAGAGLPSTTSIGAEIRTDGGSATLAEGIRIWSVGANSITTGIKFMGTVTAGIDFAGTMVPDATRTNYAFSVGNRAAELTVDMGNAASQNFEPVQMNVNFTASGGAPTSTSTARLIRVRSTHDTTDMANLRIMSINTYMDVQKNMEAAYGVMHGVDFHTNAVAITTEAAVGAFNVDAASAVTGNVRGIIVNMAGAGLPSTTSIGLEVRTDGGSATLAEGIRIWSVGGNSITNGINFTGTVTNVLDFASNDSSQGAKVAATNTGAINADGLIKIDIANVSYWIPFFASGSITGDW